jgi:hypothetical protein
MGRACVMWGDIPVLYRTRTMGFESRTAGAVNTT